MSEPEIETSAAMFALSIVLGSSVATIAATESSAPDFGPNVKKTFDPSMTDVQQQLDTIFKHQERNEFGTDRYALLYKPGKYNLDAQRRLLHAVRGTRAIAG